MTNTSIAKPNERAGEATAGQLLRIGPLVEPPADDPGQPPRLVDEVQRKLFFIL